jgi:hypothetical protein
MKKPLKLFILIMLAAVAASLLNGGEFPAKIFLSLVRMAVVLGALYFSLKWLRKALVFLRELATPIAKTEPVQNAWHSLQAADSHAAQAAQKAGLGGPIQFFNSLRSKIITGLDRASKR